MCVGDGNYRSLYLVPEKGFLLINKINTDSHFAVLFSTDVPVTWSIHIKMAELLILWSHDQFPESKWQSFLSYDLTISFQNQNGGVSYITILQSVSRIKMAEFLILRSYDQFPELKWYIFLPYNIKISSQNQNGRASYLTILQ